MCTQRSYAFRGDGPGTVLDTSGDEYVTREPNADERERDMRFLTGTTSLPDGSISKQQRIMLLGQAMDLNMLTWILAIVNMEQCRVEALSATVVSYYEWRAFWQDLPLAGTSGKVVGGDSEQSRHPWEAWGNLFPQASHFGGVSGPYETLEHWAERTFFANDVAAIDHSSLTAMVSTESGDSMTTGIA